MKTKLGLLLAACLALASRAQARIGWTYEQCVAHWGKETSHLFLHGEEPPYTKPIFVFHYHKRYVVVEFRDDKVIKETPSNSPTL
jgi:hypothetical protein